MVQSVELLVDDDTENRIRWEWQVLTDAGLPCQGNHRGPTNRPHVTLAVAARLPGGAEPGIAAAVSGLPLPLIISAPAVFGNGPYILVRTVLASVALLSLQERVAAAVGPAGAGFDRLQPDRWAPHVTLARRMSAADIAAALTLLSPFPDLVGSAPTARRWDSDRKVAWLVGGVG